MGSKVYKLKIVIKKLEAAGFKVSAHEFKNHCDKIIATQEKHIPIEIVPFPEAPVHYCFLQSMSCHYYPLTSINHAIMFSSNQFQNNND